MTFSISYLSFTGFLFVKLFAGERIDFLNEEPYKNNLQAASIDASVLLKTFLRSLGEPVITNALYHKLFALSGILNS